MLCACCAAGITSSKRTGAAALRLVKERHPDLIVLDAMPESTVSKSRAASKVVSATAKSRSSW